MRSGLTLSRERTDGDLCCFPLAWSGLYSASVSGETQADGTVTFISGKVKSGGTFTLRVDDVVKSGYTYDPALNVETSDSVTVP